MILLYDYKESPVFYRNKTVKFRRANVLTISRLIITQPNKKCLCGLKIITVFLKKKIKIDVEAKSYSVSEH